MYLCPSSISDTLPFYCSNNRRRISHTSTTTTYAERSPIGNAHGRHFRAPPPSHSSHKWSFQTCKTTWLWGTWCLQCLHTHSILTKTVKTEPSVCFERMWAHGLTHVSVHPQSHIAVFHECTSFVCFVLSTNSANTSHVFVLLTIDCPCFVVC